MSQGKTFIKVSGNGVDKKFSTFTKACRRMGWPYNYLKRCPMPKKYRGYLIERIKMDDIE